MASFMSSFAAATTGRQSQSSSPKSNVAVIAPLPPIPAAAAPSLPDRHDDYDAAAVHELRKQLRTSQVRHREENYWLTLELATARRERESMEDCVTELYRELRDMVGANGSPNVVRVMENQIALLRTSSHNVVRSLQDELRELLDDKSKLERDLMNRLAALEREKRQLQGQVQQQLQQQQQQEHAMPPLLKTLSHHQTPRGSTTTIATPSPVKLVSPVPATSTTPTTNTSNLNEHPEHSPRQVEAVVRLVEQKQALQEQLAARTTEALDARDHAAKLQRQVDKLQGDLALLKTSVKRIVPAVAAARGMSNVAPQESFNVALEAQLQRVAELWHNADTSMTRLEPIMTRISELDAGELGLSTLETATLVHGQLKVSLMLIELQLRNSLTNVGSRPAARVKVSSNDDVLADNAIASRITTAQDEALQAVQQLNDQLHQWQSDIETRATRDAMHVKEVLQAKQAEQVAMQTRQAQLQAKLEQALQQLHEYERQHDVHSTEQRVSASLIQRLEAEVDNVVLAMTDRNRKIEQLRAIVQRYQQEAALHQGPALARNVGAAAAASIPAVPQQQPRLVVQRIAYGQPMPMERQDDEEKKAESYSSSSSDGEEFAVIPLATAVASAAGQDEEAAESDDALVSPVQSQDAGTSSSSSALSTHRGGGADGAFPGNDESALV